MNKAISQASIEGYGNSRCRDTAGYADMYSAGYHSNAMLILRVHLLVP